MGEGWVVVNGVVVASLRSRPTVPWLVRPRTWTPDEGGCLATRGLVLGAAWIVETHDERVGRCRKVRGVRVMLRKSEKLVLRPSTVKTIELGDYVGVRMTS